MSDPTPTGHVPAKKKKPLVLIIAVALVVVAAAGGGAWFFMRGKSTAEAAETTKEEKKDEKKLSERGLVKLDPFIVNLADEGGKRFLRASIQLVVEDEKEALEFEEKPVLTMGARSAIVNTLTTQTAESLGTPEGKEELRVLLREHVSEALKVEIVDVLLSDFVVQY
ncbi:MAG: flagellar basal body-associated FliL family protein [Vicinamibacterales bacterium]